MPRPIVDASTIARLRTLLIAHNESGVGEKAKLGDLKKVYTTGWTGEEKALARVQAHLEKLAKAEEFDESKHRRDEDGRFAPKGGGGRRGGAQAAQPRQQQPAPQRRDPNEIQVIPETRFTTIGPAAAGAAGLAVGALRGAVPAVGRGIDRVVAEMAGLAAGTATKRGAQAILAVGDKIEESVAGQVPLAGENARYERRQAVLSAAGKAGRQKVRDAVYGGLQAVQNAGPNFVRNYFDNNMARLAADPLRPTGAKWAGRRFGMRSSRLAGAMMAGAIVPGIAYGYMGYKAAQAAGPTLDSLFPRRVEKLAKAALIPATAEAVELLAPHEEDLQKFSLAGARAAISGVASRAGAAVSRGVGAARARLDAIGRAPVRGAGTKLGNAPKVDTAARASRIYGRTAIQGIGAGAVVGVGGLAGGAVANAGARIYYRDEKGQFTSKDRAVWGMTAAGAVTGAGIAAYLLRGRNRAAAARMLEQWGVTGERNLGEKPASVVPRFENGSVQMGTNAEGKAVPVAMRGEKGGVLWADKADANEITASGAKVLNRVRDRAEKRFDLLNADRKAVVDRALYDINTTINAASNTPASWAKHAIEAERDKAMLALLGAKGSLQADKAGYDKARTAIRKAVASGEDWREVVRNSPHLTDATKTKLLDFDVKAQGAVAAYEKRIADIEWQHQGAVNKHTAAKEALKAADDATAAAEKHLKTLETERDAKLGQRGFGPKARERMSGDIDKAKAALATAEEAGGKAQKAVNSAKGEVDKLARQLDPNKEHPKATNPFTGQELPEVLPSSARVAELIEERAKPISDAFAARRQAFIDERVKGAEDVMRGTYEALRRLATPEPGLARRLGSVIAGSIGQHVADAQRGLRMFGGDMWAAIRAKLGNGPQALADYARAANAKAKEWLGKAYDFGRKHWGKILVGGAALGLWDYNDDGTVNFSPTRVLDRARDLIGGKSPPPKPYYRILNAGRDNQTVIVGVATADGKTFVAGFYEKNGKRVAIEPMTNVQELYNNLRNSGQQQGQGQKPPKEAAPKVAAHNAQEQTSWDQALQQIRDNGKIGTVGDDDHAFEYNQSEDHNLRATSVRDSIDAEGRKVSGTMAGGFDGRTFFDQAARIFDSEQSPLLRLSDKRNLILGTDKLKGLLDSDFRSAMEADGLDVAFEKRLGLKGSEKGAIPKAKDDDQATNLIRIARALNASAKEGQRLGDNQMAELEQKIGAHRREAPQPKPAEAPSASQAGFTRESMERDAIQRVRDTLSDGLDPSVHTDAQYLKLINGYTDRSGRVIPSLVEREWYQSLAKVRQLAEQRGEAMDDAVEIATVRDHLEKEIKQRIAKSRAAAAAKEASDTPLLDRLAVLMAEPADTLVKFAGGGHPFEESKHKRAPRGAEGGGRFTANPSAHGVRPQRAAAQQQPQQPEQDDRSYFEPVRLGATLGGAVAGQAGYMLAERFLPAPLRNAAIGARLAARVAAAGGESVFGRGVAAAAGGAVGAAGRMAGWTGRTAGKVAGSMAAGTAGAIGGDQAGAALYAARGQQAPGSYQPPEQSVGEMASRFGGSMGGSMAGMAAGAALGPVGVFAGGVVGGLAGEELMAAAHSAITRRYGPDFAARALGALMPSRAA